MSKYKLGTSGNPAGRPRGIVDKRKAVMLELEKDLPALVEKIKTSALAGDMQAMQILITRLLPVRKSSAETVDLPELASAGSLIEKADAILNAIAAGDIAPDIGAQLVTAIGTTARVEEITELRERLEALERATKEAK